MFKWRSSGSNVSIINNTQTEHRFRQYRWKCTAIVTNSKVKQMCIPKEYIINSELIKIYKCFKAFSKFFFKLFCYLAEGSQRHLRLNFLINPSHTGKEFNPSAKALLMWFFFLYIFYILSNSFFNFLEKTFLKRLCWDIVSILHLWRSCIRLSQCMNYQWFTIRLSAKQTENSINKIKCVIP